MWDICDKRSLWSGWAVQGIRGIRPSEWSSCSNFSYSGFLGLQILNAAIGDREHVPPFKRRHGVQILKNLRVSLTTPTPIAWDMFMHTYFKLIESSHHSFGYFSLVFRFAGLKQSEWKLLEPYHSLLLIALMLSTARSCHGQSHWCWRPHYVSSLRKLLFSSAISRMLFAFFWKTPSISRFFCSTRTQTSIRKRVWSGQAELWTALGICQSLWQLSSMMPFKTRLLKFQCK